MTNDGSQPPGRDHPIDHPDDDARIEIPLTGDGVDPARASGTARSAPNRRRIVGLSVLGGVALGIAVAAVVLTSSNGDEQPPATTTDPIDPDDPSAAITVPPTLTPVTEPAVTVPPTSDAPSGTVSTDLTAVVASVDTLPPRPDADPSTLTGHQLSDGSLAALDNPVARRSVTDHVVGVDGFEQTVTITNDPVNERYRLEFAYGDAVDVMIVDIATDTSYIELEAGEWVTVSNRDIVGSTNMESLLRNLQLGPIRSDTRGAWELTQANSLVETSGDETLREWIVVLDANAVPEWARYAFGPGGDAAPVSGNTKVAYAVYVRADGSIHRVSGSSEYGTTTQQIVHRVEELDDPSAIELPATGLTEEPAADASVPPTTAPTG